ncbi:MAG: hypothetical protein AB4063_12490 [Crocosphaera sp.]
MKFPKDHPIRSLVQNILVSLDMLGSGIRDCFHTPGINLLLWLIIFQLLITIGLTYSITPSQVRYPLGLETNNASHSLLR